MNVEEVKIAEEAIDAAELQRKLKAAVEGEVRFDKGSKAAYSTDGSNYRQIPIGVVLPRTREDIVNTVRICREFSAPVLSRGGGTSLAGQCCNVAVIMDMSKYYNRVLHLDADERLVTVEPGIVLDSMRQVTERYSGLTFGPDPATHDHCTIGGMMGNNSCGSHSIMSLVAGLGSRVSDNTERMTVLTYDGLVMDVGPTSDEELERFIGEGGRKGEIYAGLKALRDKYADQIRTKFPAIPRRVSGYNLDELLPEKGFNVARALVGTESTCVVILQATLKLIPKPRVRCVLLVAFPDICSAGSHAPIALKHHPTACEGLDDKLIDFMQRQCMNVKDLELLPKGPKARGWLLVEFGADTVEEADKKAKGLRADFEKEKAVLEMSLFDKPEQIKKLWEIRESALGATTFIPGLKDSWAGWEDSAVHPDKVGDYLQDLQQLFKKYDYTVSLYGHFGDGCIHCNVDFDLFTKQGLENYRNFTVEAAKLVLKYNGSLSGEHGDGQSKADLLGMMYGPELLEAFREFKMIWDPEWQMNPGKVVDPYGQLSNLRLGTAYNPPNPKTHFHFPEDGNNFAHAALRCVGVGKCRHHEHGTMCPSYMVTREEEHSTRGRARLLFEMLQGDVITDGWKSKEVKNALDLCLSCKGCKGDCPVNVDMATYKSEFLSHYYAGRLRPSSAYAFGWIYWWARLASHAPRLVNFLTQNPITGPLAKKLAGVAPQRSIPVFADLTFRDWFRQRVRPGSSRPKVILWADTFNNFFLPETLVAGTEVLEAAGFEVIVPRQMLCCGRPLYDFGMLRTAKHLLRQILSALKDEIRDGIPIVGLEPSCVAVFRDELVNLFPTDEDAKRLKKQVFTLAEFLDKKAPDFKIPSFNAKALVHTHCHHKAVASTDSDVALFKRMKLDYQLLDSGCCGMAGYFGYENGVHYDVAQASGERVLLPTIRSADQETVIMADGFSCREQIQQNTDRKGLHLAQVIQMALRDEKTDLAYPEIKYVDKMKLKDGSRRKKVAAVALGLSVFTVAALVTGCIMKKK